VIWVLDQISWKTTIVIKEKQEEEEVQTEKKRIETFFVMSERKIEEETIGFAFVRLGQTNLQNFTKRTKEKQ